MRRFQQIFCLAFMALLLLSAVSVPLHAQGKDERAVLALIARLTQALNSVDPAVVRRTYPEYSRLPARLFPPFETTSATAAELDASLEQILAPLASRSFRVTTSPTVERKGDLAWTSFEWEVQYRFKDGGQQDFAGRATIIFVKERNWKLKHWHASLAAGLPPSESARAEAAAAILALEYANWNAFKNKNSSSLAGNLATDFSILQPDSAYRMQGKDDYIRYANDWMSKNELSSFQIADPKVEIIGETGLITYYFTFSATEGGQSVSLSGKATTLYKKEGESWKALHHHASLNPAPGQ